MKLRPNPPIILILAGLTFFLFFKFSPKAPEDPQKATSQSSSTSFSPSTSPTPSTEIDPTNTDPRFTRFLDGRIHWQASFTTSRQLHQSPDPKNDLHLVEQLLSHYRLLYKENPVGTDNAEITAALLGENPKNVYFLDPHLSALNQHRELLDRWGTPFIFHPLKADLMDIRSPGPDRKPWTADDLTLGYQNAEAELRLKK